MLKPRRDQVVAWRGPMLDRALVQMLADVYWGDLDVLLLDLPPGTGDIAISLGQHLPGAEVLVVTTPQEAAAEVAERAGTMASMLHQRVVGVLENMVVLPSCDRAPARALRQRRWRTGGGDPLAQRFGYDVPLLGRDRPDRGVPARGWRLRRAGGRVRPHLARRPGARVGRRAPRLRADVVWRRHSSASPRPLSSNHVRGRSAGFAVIAFVAVLVFGPDRLPTSRARPDGWHASCGSSPATPATSSARKLDGVRRPRPARPRSPHHRQEGTSSRNAMNEEMNAPDTRNGLAPRRG